MFIINILVGIAALILGRKLFWLFVGAIGFVYGMNITVLFSSGLPDLLVVVIALIAGLIGALVAVFFQKVAVVLVGFAAGGYLIASLLNIAGWKAVAVPVPWLPFLIGGLAGALLLYFLFDWTLIFFSSIIGASLISQSIQIDPFVKGLLFVGLFIVGFVTQAGMLKRNRK
ncbi:MAG: DUF4203 domain-containing protein [Desulfobacteraceae bacterium]|nr:DUF4203 domain-containing protein [Desulfobacterales bacterium]MBL6967224.1 DUF4203 domain-containing protein [Desulfobacteraceae bacterium]MBL7171621.1 DUF4203 domain-containing protein [Desulfobacteraceae bacterium]